MTANTLRETVARLLREGAFPMIEVARKLGVPVSVFQLHREAMAGRLLTCRIAGKRCTSEAAFLDWIEQRSRLPERIPKPARRNGRRAKPKTSPEARRFLESRGLRVGGGDQ